MLIALAQIDPTVGDVEGNAALLRESIAGAREAGAQLVLFPELALSGYTAGDLLLREDFLARCARAAEQVAGEAAGIVAAFGAPVLGVHDLHNALVVAAGGRIAAVYDKVELPTYGVFDEARWFGQGAGSPLVRVGEHLVGLTVCADLWIADGPATAAVRSGARLILNASASTFHAGKARQRDAMLRQRAIDLICPIAYCNAWGGEEELIFDGGSMVVDHRGEVLARAEQFRDELLVCEVDLPAVRLARLRDPRLRTARTPEPARAPLAELALPPPAPGAAPRSPRLASALAPEQELWGALVAGIAARARHAGRRGAAVSLDGGIGSAVVAALAADALGGERVAGVVLSSLDADPDAAAAARDAAVALGCTLHPVEVDALEAAFSDATGAASPRLRAATRAHALAGLAEANGWLLLSGADKSLLACGFAMPGGDLAPLGDVWHTAVARLATWRRRRGTLPFVDVPPPAWLEAGLPPYAEADPILEAYVEDEQDPTAIVARGQDAGLVRRLVALVEEAEPARRRAAPALKVSVRAFGRDRRMPLHHGFALGPAPEDQAAASSAGTDTVSSGLSSSA